ncbi:MAG: hypothetical protein PW843_03270 [Azospirillaceae bacterium]|nr:hypothetical protein [Azospirillaceae bacterium]
MKGYVSFESEVLHEALEEGFVQSILQSIAPAWGLSEDEAFRKIIELAKQGFFTFFDDENGFAPLEIERVTYQYVKSHYYTNMLKTDLTIPRINEIWTEYQARAKSTGDDRPA